MMTDKPPWLGYEEVVRQLGQSWIETRFVTWMLLERLPELEADPSAENWQRVIPLSQYLFTVGMQFEIAARELADSDEEWAKLVMPMVDEIRRTLVAETEWAGTRMQVLTERAHEMNWPFPFRHFIR